jgi:hypothetical protein
MKQGLLFVLMGVLSLSLMAACDKDEPKGDIDNSKWEVGIIIDENGNVVQTEIVESELSVRSIFVYKNGVFDHLEQQMRYASNRVAKDILKIANINPNVSDVRKKGNVITLEYKPGYLEIFRNYTAEELKELLQEEE